VIETVELEHVSAALVRTIDKALSGSIFAVESDAVASATVSLSLKVAKDEDGETVVSFDQKTTDVRKGTWTPGDQNQLHLNLQEPAEAAVRRFRDMCKRDGVTVTMAAGRPN
jgi:hypothetical protein